MNRQSYVARKLYSGRTNEVNLSESNIKHAIQVMNELHATYPDSIGLISDITSFIGIGDILFQNFDRLSVIELKQGKMNEVVKNIILEGEKAGIATEILISQVEKNYNKDISKQTQRMINQSIRMTRLSHIINTGASIDNNLRLPSLIFDKTLDSTSFTSTLIEMVDKLLMSNEHWQYEIVENCIHIGVCKNSFYTIGCNLISNSIFSKSGKNFPVFNYIKFCLDDPLSEPYFIKPFTNEQLVAMTLGKVIIFIAINFDELINIFRNFGLKADWISRKKTNEVNSDFNNKNFTFNHQSIQVSLNDDLVFFVGGGLVFRIIFSHILPSCIAQSMINNLMNESGLINKLDSTLSERDSLPIFIDNVNLNLENNI
ncbi:MAG TPA: hypothetical protein VK203_02875 [Nostocaceae cyanobacterium]|nr:hypothetical protein [Nostocaceae cyanobacterium]